MYKEGVRWTERLTKHSVHPLEPFRSVVKFVVLDYILTISITVLQDNYHDHPLTLVMLILITKSQELGHMSFEKNAQLENKMDMDEVTINFFWHVLDFLGIYSII